MIVFLACCTTRSTIQILQSSYANAIDYAQSYCRDIRSIKQPSFLPLITAHPFPLLSYIAISGETLPERGLRDQSFTPLSRQRLLKITGVRVCWLYNSFLHCCRFVWSIKGRRDGICHYGVAKKRCGNLQFLPIGRGLFTKYFYNVTLGRQVNKWRWAYSQMLMVRYFVVNAIKLFPGLINLCCNLSYSGIHYVSKS